MLSSNISKASLLKQAITVKKVSLVSLLCLKFKSSKPAQMSAIQSVNNAQQSSL
jgi:hypothetical protein